MSQRTTNKEQTTTVLNNKDEANNQEVEAGGADNIVVPEPEEETWKILYDAYRHVKLQKKKEPDNHEKKDPSSSSSLSVHDTRLFQAVSHRGICGFRVPFAIQQSSNSKGRGVFATSNIAKGTFVWDSRDGQFVNESEWTNFLTQLQTSTQPNLVHDVHVWAYVSWLDDDERQYVGLDLDPGSLMNHAGESVDHNGQKLGSQSGSAQQELPNLDEYESDDDWWHLVANRDIQAGEEFLCDYSKFHDYETTLDWYQKSWERHAGIGSEKLGAS